MSQQLIEIKKANDALRVHGWKIRKGVNGVHFTLPRGQQWTEELASLAALTTQVQEMLDKANGARKSRLLFTSDIAKVMRKATEQRFHHVNGGIIKSAYAHSSRKTTIALAFVKTRFLTIGITECPAYRASLGRAWPEFNGLGNMRYTPHCVKYKNLRHWSRLVTTATKTG